MRRLAVVALLALVVGPVTTRTEPAAVFAAAVLRRDGAMIPIGTFNGKKWRVSWPAESYDQLEIPIRLESIPRGWWGGPGMPAEWQVWWDGARHGTIHAVAPRVVGTMCSGRIALQTNYSGAGAPPETVQPYPKVGIAVSSPAVSVARIEILGATSRERQSIVTSLKKVFDDDEDSLAAAWTRANDPHPIPRKERLATPVTIEAMYATDDGPDRVYYVEASRKYDHSNDERPLCAVAFGTAYFRLDDQKSAHALGGEMRVVPCDRRGLVYMLPFGAIRLDGRLFWLTQYSGWDFEQYNIVELKRSKVEVAASTYGGRCPAPQS